MENEDLLAQQYEKLRSKFGYSADLLHKQFTHPKMGESVFLGFKGGLYRSSAIFKVIATGEHFRQDEETLRSYIERGVVLIEELGIR